MSASSGGSAPISNITGYKQKNLSRFTPQQSQLLESMIEKLTGGQGLSGGIDWLSRIAGGDEETFEAMEKPAYSAFNKQLGEIGNRFAGVGGLDSSGFQNATAGAAKEFGEGIGANRIAMRNQSIERLLGLSNNLLNKQPYDSFLEKDRNWGETGGDIMSLLGKLLPLFGKDNSSSAQSQGGWQKGGDMLGILAKILPLLL